MRPAKQGDSKTTEVPVEKAFGPYLEERVVGVPKNTLARWGPEPVTGERVPIPQRILRCNRNRSHRIQKANKLKLQCR